MTGLKPREEILVLKLSHKATTVERPHQFSVVRKRYLKRAILLAGACIMISLGPATHYESIPGGIGTVKAQTRSFYEGKTVRLIIGPGGGYDYWGRLLARHMAKHIPGNPAFIVQNMPGAGSVIATNYVYNIAKPDGLTVGMPTQQIYMGEFVGNNEVKFQMRKFLWIGSPDRNPVILYLRADAPYKSIHDVINGKERPKCGGTGWESSSLIVALEDAIGAQFEFGSDGIF